MRGTIDPFTVMRTTRGLVDTNLCIIGKVDAAVFLAPVCAQPNQSALLRTMGLACGWMGVVTLYPSSLSARNIGSMRLNDSKVINFIRMCAMRNKTSSS